MTTSKSGPLSVVVVDFNEWDDDDLTPGLSAAEMGDRVHLLDWDGNVCEGTVERVLEGSTWRYAFCRPDWSTWWPQDQDVLYDDGSTRVRAKYRPLT